MIYANTIIELGLIILMFFGSTSWGYIFLRIGWPNIRTLEIEYKSGASLIVGLIFSILTIGISLIAQALKLTELSLTELLLINTTIIFITGILIFTVKRKFLGSKNVKVSIPKRVISANVIAKKAMLQLPKNSYLKVNKQGEEKILELQQQREMKKQQRIEIEQMEKEQKEMEKQKIQEEKRLNEKNEIKERKKQEEKINETQLLKLKQNIEKEPLTRTKPLSEAEEKKKQMKQISKDELDVSSNKITIPEEAKSQKTETIHSQLQKPTFEQKEIKKPIEQKGKQKNKLMAFIFGKKSKELKQKPRHTHEMRKSIFAKPLTLPSFEKKPIQTRDKFSENKRIRGAEEIISNLEKKSKEKGNTIFTNEQLDSKIKKTETYIKQNLKETLEPTPEKKKPDIIEAMPKSAKLLKELLKETNGDEK